MALRESQDDADRSSARRPNAMRGFAVPNAMLGGACGGGSFCTGVEGPFEPPPLLPGAGDDATGSLAGWIAAGLRFFVVAPASGVALFFSGLFVFLFSDLFVFRLFSCAPPAATGAAAGGADAASSDGWET